MLTTRFSPSAPVAASGKIVIDPSARGVKYSTSPAPSPRASTQFFGSETMNVEPPVFWMRRPWNPPLARIRRPLTSANLYSTPHDGLGYRLRTAL